MGRRYNKMRQKYPHPTESRSPKNRSQGFLGSTVSGDLLLEVASWLSKKRLLFVFSQVSFGIVFGIFRIFLDFFWFVFGLQKRMPWGLSPIFNGGFPKKCPGAWHPFFCGGFLKKMPWGLAPIFCGGFPEKMPWGLALIFCGSSPRNALGPGTYF